MSGFTIERVHILKSKSQEVDANTAKREVAVAFISPKGDAFFARLTLTSFTGFLTTFISNGNRFVDPTAVEWIKKVYKKEYEALEAQISAGYVIVREF